jgi:hypothetical protein
VFQPLSSEPVLEIFEEVPTERVHIRISPGVLVFSDFML